MEEKGYWFSTENGTHIHAEEGQSKKEAMDKKFKSFGKKKEEKSLKVESRSMDNEMKSSSPDKLADKMGENEESKIPEPTGDLDKDIESITDIDDLENMSKELKTDYEKVVDYDKNEEIDWDLVDKNEKINGSNAKSKTRKDEYGNPLVSDEAFNVGVEAGKSYLEHSLKFYTLEQLKKSNVFLGYMHQIVNNAIVNNGFDPDLDTTYQDANEIIGNVLGEEIDYAQYSTRQGSGYTGKKYTGYKPQQEQTKKPSVLDDVKYAIDNNLDIGRVITDKIKKNPEQYKEIEIGNKKYVQKGSSYEMYRDGKLISTGTFNSVGADIADTFKKFNSKNIDEYIKNNEWHKSYFGTKDMPF